MSFVNQCGKWEMARGSLFNDIEKGQNLTNVVANFLRARGEYGIKRSGGRPTKLGKREKKKDNDDSIK
uniref:Transposase n=1 Tax=Heterorhabditis bacteriophora TaxID=37862 RepID=A0A1I7XDE3_HETBA